MDHNDANDLLDKEPFSRSSPSDSDTTVGDEEHFVSQSTKDNIGLPAPSVSQQAQKARPDKRNR